MKPNLLIRTALRTALLTAALALTWSSAASANENQVQSVSNGGKTLKVFSLSSGTKQSQRDENEEVRQHRFLIQGGLHGNEKLTVTFVEWLKTRIARGQSPLNKIPNATFDLLPRANPDGLAKDSRYNQNGVNLNRNFAVLFGLTKENPGESAFSEPETRHLRRLFEKNSYTAAVDVHGYINWIVAPSSPRQLWELGAPVDPVIADLHLPWKTALEEEMTLLRGYQLRTAGGLGDGGSFEDYAFWQHGTLAFCLELRTKRRHRLNYRRNFQDIRRHDPLAKIDTFPMYEAYMYRVFRKAIEIHERAATESVASNP